MSIHPKGESCGHVRSHFIPGACSQSPCCQASGELRTSAEAAAAGVSERLQDIERQTNVLDAERSELAAASAGVQRERKNFEREHRVCELAMIEAKGATAGAYTGPHFGSK
jgi:hypothetical protein